MVTCPVAATSGIPRSYTRHSPILLADEPPGSVPGRGEGANVGSTSPAVSGGRVGLSAAIPRHDLPFGQAGSGALRLRRLRLAPSSCLRDFRCDPFRRSGSTHANDHRSGRPPRGSHRRVSCVDPATIRLLQRTSRRASPRCLPSCRRGTRAQNRLRIAGARSSRRW